MALAPIEEALRRIRDGEMVLVVDDEDRENEGDLCIAAVKVTPEAITFMAVHGRGLICLALTKGRVEELGLDLMSRNNGTRHETAFTISIEAREGVVTQWVDARAKKEVGGLRGLLGDELIGHVDFRACLVEIAAGINDTIHGKQDGLPDVLALRELT